MTKSILESFANEKALSILFWYISDFYDVTENAYLTQSDLEFLNMVDDGVIATDELVSVAEEIASRIDSMDNPYFPFAAWLERRKND